MDVEARPAAVDDLAVLTALVAAAVDEQIDARGGALWALLDVRAEPRDATFAADLEDPDRRVRVGTIDGVPVGYGVAGVMALSDGSLLGRISDLFVLPGARGVGVGEAMADELVAWCTERGCRGIDAIALPGNRHTKNFFETFGFTARSLTVHRRLDGDA